MENRANKTMKPCHELLPINTYAAAEKEMENKEKSRSMLRALYLLWLAKRHVCWQYLIVACSLIRSQVMLG